MRAVLVGLLACLALAGCSDDGSRRTDDQVITVFAAASLKGPFEELGRQLDKERDGVEVRFVFAGSSDLVAQLQQGADADVVATADERNMDKLTGEDLVEEPLLFATNTLTIAVPPDNPAGISSLDDVAGDVKLVVCAPEVPCGAAATELADVAGVALSPVSEEQSVTDVLNKVISGEADAGLVYVTDVQAAGDQVEGIEVPEAAEVVNAYPIAALADSEEPDLAQAFVDLVVGDEGTVVLTQAGFGRP